MGLNIKMARNDKCCQEASNNKNSFMIENMALSFSSDNPGVYLPCSCTNGLYLDTSFPQRALMVSVLTCL